MTLDSVASKQLAFKLNTKERLVQQVHHKVKQQQQVYSVLPFVQVLPIKITINS